ncbi:hypothetical protein AB1Y20_022748, partial [Prymnesium parvum]
VHRENGRVAFYPRRNGSLHSWTIFKLLAGLLLVGLFLGWTLRHRMGTAGREEPASVHVAEEGSTGRLPATSARRRLRQKRFPDEAFPV